MEIIILLTMQITLRYIYIVDKNTKEVLPNLSKNNIHNESLANNQTKADHG